MALFCPKWVFGSLNKLEMVHWVCCCNTLWCSATWWALCFGSFTRVVLVLFAFSSLRKDGQAACNKPSGTPKLVNGLANSLQIAYIPKNNGGPFIFGFFFAAGFVLLFLGSSFYAFLFLCFFCFFCFSAFLLLCFSAFCFPCFSAFPASLLFCFLLILLLFFSASLFSLLLCFCTSDPFYLVLSTSTILLFLFFSHVLLLLYFLLLCFFASCLYCLFVFHFRLLYIFCSVCILHETLERP